MRLSTRLTAFLIGGLLQTACTADLDLLGDRRRVQVEVDAGRDAGIGGSYSPGPAAPQEAYLPGVGLRPPHVAPRDAGVRESMSDSDTSGTESSSTEASDRIADASSEVNDPSDAALPSEDGGTRGPEDASVSSEAGSAPDAATEDNLTDAVDAGPPTECQLACAAAGGECADEQRCEFDCSKPGACAGDLICPDGYDCFVACGDQSCSGKVRCPDEDADDCRVECLGENSCAGGVECRGGTCDIACEGEGSCAGSGVRVRGRANATANVSCSGDGSCSCDVGSRCDAVDCAIAHCNVDCSGVDSCACSGSGCGSVASSAQTIRTRCSGTDSCNGNVSCNGDRCDVQCNRGAGACGGSIYCNTGQKLGDCP